MNRISRTSLAATALVTLLSLTACGGDASGSARPEPVATPEPLSLSEHVLSGTELPGFTTDAVPEVLDLAAFAEEHEKTVAELEASGMVAGASVQFQPATKAKAFALSVAAQYTSTAGAEAEADRLFASNSEPEDGMTVTPLEVPGIPGAQAVTLTGVEKGKAVTGVEIVFVDGTVTHEVFAVGLDPVVSVDGIVAAAQSLYDEVHGRPVS